MAEEMSADIIESMETSSTMAASNNTYQLISQINAHQGAVRAIDHIINPIDGSLLFILSGGADACVRIWDPLTLNIIHTLPHDHSVVSLHIDYKHQYIITGCMDSIIRIYNFQFAEIIRLKGHNKGVISFSVFNDYLISGSWDGSARVWNLISFECEKCIDGHENGVHVLALPNGHLITTSTGEAINNKPCHFYIRIYNLQTCALLHPPMESHEASIRNIKDVPDIGFVTCSNDGTVRLFTYEGDLIETMCHPHQDDGSPPFLMDVSLLSIPDLSFVSVGEDSSVIVWTNTAVSQSIPHPASMWCVNTLPGLDFCTGSHDGCIRIFSKDDSKTTLEGAIALQINFAIEVQEAISSRNKGPSAEDLAKAPKWDQASTRPGTSDQQVCVFNKEGRLIAAQWSDSSRVWIEMGEVVSGPEQREEINGVPYDMVLPVEMDSPSGDRHLKIGYNNGENPFVAAQRFIEQNSLDPSFLNQIADWIIQRTAQSSRTPTIGASGVPALPQPIIGDPTRIVQANVKKFLPLSHMFYYDDVPSGLRAKLVPKLHDMNTSIIDHHLSLSTSEFEYIVTCAMTLEATNRYHSSQISLAEIASTVKMIGWDSSKLAIPFDILRMIAAHPNGSETMASTTSKIQLIFNRIQDVITDRATSITVITVIFRFLCNCFRFDHLRNTIMNNDSIVTSLSDVIRVAIDVTLAGGNKNCKVAFTNLLANISASLSDAPGKTAPLYSSVIKAAKSLLEGESTIEEVLNSLALTFGTIIVTRKLRNNIMGELISDVPSIAREFEAATARWTGQQLTDITKAVLAEMQAVMK